MRRGRILVIDDKDTMRDLLVQILSDDHDVTGADSAERALSILTTDSFDVVLSDIRMPGADGFAVLDHVRADHPELEVLLLTAYGTVERAVDAMRRGAYDYLTKPFEPGEVRVTVAKALAHKRLRDQARDLRRELDRRAGFGNLVGDSPAMQRIYNLIDKVAARPTTVLVVGPSGTGKELVARAIHDTSPRRDAAWVAINCGALPESLLESELFGHARGAFTGAVQAKVGLLQKADGGTVFLDEINSMPLPLQVKLNRVLAERTIRRVGDTVDIAVDVRVIAAANVDLEKAVVDQTFREDLLYRLMVFPIQMPPLSERREDIPALVAHFVAKHDTAASVDGREVRGVTAEFLKTLLGYAWPGNVRELENVIERALILEDSEELTLASLPGVVVAGDRPPSAHGDLADLTYKQAVELARDRASREYLQSLMTSFDGNVTRAAERAGIERESLHRLLKKYAIKPEDFRSI